MILQIVNALVNVVTAAPSHTAPAAPVVAAVTTVSTAATTTVNHGFEVLKLKPW